MQPCAWNGAPREEERQEKPREASHGGDGASDAINLG